MPFEILRSETLSGPSQRRLDLPKLDHVKVTYHPDPPAVDASPPVPTAQQAAQSPGPDSDILLDAYLLDLALLTILAFLAGGGILWGMSR